jgi:hypothetical protein
MASMNAPREPNVRTRTAPRFGQRGDLSHPNGGPDSHRFLLTLRGNGAHQKVADPSDPKYSGVHPGSGAAKEGFE